MDEKDRLLLAYLHKGLPFVRQPFGELAAKAGLDTAEVFVRVQRLKKEGVLPEIQPVWDPRKFHYQSAWVAMRFSSSEFSLRAISLLEHPGIVYGCARNDEFNLWFLITVPPDHDLEMHVRCLEKISGAEQTLLFPVRKILKGGNLLSALEDKALLLPAERFEKGEKGRPSELLPEEIEMIRHLQGPFPLTDEPYRKIASDLGLTEDRALDRVKTLVQKGCLKRIGSFAPPAHAETPARTLVVWKVPEEKLEHIRTAIAELKEVLYSDYRTTYPVFPYSLYTVLATAGGAEFETILRNVEDRIGKWPRKVLVTTQEFKKAPMRYFAKELDVWWDQHHTVVETAFDHNER